MSEHLSDLDIERYRRRKMAPAELLASNDHLAICERCYQRSVKEGQLERAYALLRTDLNELDRAGRDHLAYDHIAAYVDDKVSGDEAKIIESHIELCQQCEAEVSDLRALKETLQADEDSVVKARASFRRRFSALWQRPAFRLTFQLAGAVVIAALFAWVATISLRGKLADLRSELAQLRGENEHLQQEFKNAENAIAELKDDLARSQSSQGDGSSNPSQQAALALNDSNGQVTLDKQGNLEGLNSLPPAYQQMVKTALTAQRIASSPVITRLAGESKNLMGGAGSDVSFTLRSPVGTATQSDRPTFRWSELSGATGYIVTVYKPNSKDMVTSELLSATEWTIPRPLKRGGIYAWQVRALKDGKEIRVPSTAGPDAKFKVLEQAKVDELALAKQNYSDSHLLSGILYAQAGLLDNAEQELQALRDANPQSRVARNLLRSVKAMRRR